MGRKTNIAWTHHTFNPWIGCRRVSPACEHCYAEWFVTHRMGKSRWGNDPRERTKIPWAEIVRWNAAAEAAGEMRRVFCASFADIFEDAPGLDEWREDVWTLVRRLRSLAFLFLTKRPENIGRMLAPDLPGRPNVWLGTTIESPDYLWRAERLLEIPAVVHFVSCEPQLEPMDFSPYVGADRINWIILGGESKQGKTHEPRPYDLAWPRTTVRLCRETSVFPFVKQLGSRPTVDGLPLRLRHHKGEDMAEWPADLQVQDVPPMLVESDKRDGAACLA